MAAKKKKLTPKQTLFRDRYCIHFNATQAAIEANYSKKTARQIGANLLSKVYMQEAIAEKLRKHEEKADITAEYILTSLKAIAERCRQAEPILDREGNPTGEYRFDSSGANKALELLGKHLKLFTERHEVDNLTPMNVEVTFK